MLLPLHNRMNPLAASIPADVRDLASLAVAYYKLEEVSGAANDATGRGNTLAATNNPVGVGALVGNGRQFVSGSSQMLRSTSTTDLQANGSADWTLAFWVNLQATQAQMLVSKTALVTTTTCEYLIQTDASNNVQFRINTGAALPIVTFGALNSSEWHFVQVGYDATGGVIWGQLDGAAPVTATATGITALGTSPDFCVAARSTNNLYASAIIDEIAIFDTYLTGAERNYLYNGGAGRSLF